MISLKLQNGMITLLDDEDAHLAVNYHWIARKSNRGLWYACCNIVLPNGKRSALRLHRLVTNAQSFDLVDHVNINGLDNRRKNLRIASSTHNRLNQRTRRDNSSGYRGVSKANHGRMWLMQIGVRGQKRIKRYYQTPEEAALGYDIAALEMHKSFAHLNFPGGFHKDAIRPPAWVISKRVQAAMSGTGVAEKEPNNERRLS